MKSLFCAFIFVFSLLASSSSWAVSESIDDNGNIVPSTSSSDAIPAPYPGTTGDNSPKGALTTVSPGEAPSEIEADEETAEDSEGISDNGDIGD